MKRTTPFFIFVFGLAAFFIGACSGILFNQHRFNDKAKELNASHELERAGVAFMDLYDWEQRGTNSVFQNLVFHVEYGVVTITPFIEEHPQSKIAMNYHELLENIRRYKARLPFHSGDTNLDSRFDKVLAKEDQESSH